MAKNISNNVSRKTTTSSTKQSPTTPTHTTLWNRPGFLIRRLHQIHVAVFLEEMSEDAITPIQYGLLSVLAESPGLDQLTLGEEAGVDRASVADVLSRLESRGLVKRIASTEDRRRKFCSVTGEGLFFVKKYFENMQRAQERLLYPLNSAERNTFMNFLHRVVEANNDLGRAPMKQATRQTEAKPTATTKKARTSK